MSFNLIGAISSIAPTLATMLGGPLAGTAVTALEGALGLTAGAGQEGITSVMQGNLSPDQIAAVRTADQKHAEIMSQQGIDIQKMNLDYQKAMVQADVADVTDARKNNVAGGTQIYLFVLSLVILAVTIGSEVRVLFDGYPPGLSEMVVGRILGLMDGISMLIVGYWYGSSHGSDRKTELANAK